MANDVWWLPDTGSDHSLLNPYDGTRLRIDYRQLTGDRLSTGISGSIRSFVEDAVVVFIEPGVALYMYALPIAVTPPDPQIRALPSLLGRDVLDRWRMVYDPTFATLEFDVRSADVRMPL